MTHPLAGRPQSSEHVAKRVAVLRAHGVYERFTQRTIAQNKARKGIPHSEELKSKISAKMIGRRNSLGTKRSLEFRQHLSRYWTGNPRHNHFIDGKNAQRNGERIVAMSRLEYRLWRTAVFERDNYTCIACGVRGGRLEADHIKPYALYPELRTSVENGRTLCRACHLLTPTHGVRSRPPRVELPI